MKVFEANITHQVSDYLNDILKNVVTIEKANQKMCKAFGFIHFFDNEEDLQILKETISISQNIVSVSADTGAVSHCSVIEWAFKLSGLKGVPQSCTPFKPVFTKLSVGALPPSELTILRK